MVCVKGSLWPALFYFQWIFKLDSMKGNGWRNPSLEMDFFPYKQAIEKHSMKKQIGNLTSQQLSTQQWCETMPFFGVSLLFCPLGSALKMMEIVCLLLFFFSGLLFFIVIS